MTMTAGAFRTSAAAAARREQADSHATARAANVSGQDSPSYRRYVKPLPWISVKDLLWALYLYPGRWLTQVSIPVMYGILRLCEPVFQVLCLRRQEGILGRLASAFGPNTPRSALRPILRAYIANAVRRAGDDLALERDNARVHCRSFQGSEHLDAAVAAGRGVLLVSVHWYAGRAANRYLAACGYPVMTVRNGEPPDTHMGRLGGKFLQPRYVSFLHGVVRDEVFIQDRECSLKILSRLRSGGIVGIQTDASFSRHLIELPFLGRMRRIPAGVLHMAHRSGCAVLPMCAFGHARALDIRIGPPVPLDRSLASRAFCETHLPVVARILETCVREHPDQWELWTRL